VVKPWVSGGHGSSAKREPRRGDERIGLRGDIRLGGGGQLRGRKVPSRQQCSARPPSKGSVAISWLGPGVVTEGEREFNIKGGFLKKAVR